MTSNRANPDQEKAASKAHYRANSDKIKAAARARYSFDPEKKAFRLANYIKKRAANLATSKAYYASNRKRIRANRRGWYALAEPKPDVRQMYVKKIRGRLVSNRKARARVTAAFNPLNAASVYIRSKITSAYRGERIYTLAIISATGQTLPIIWHA